MAGWSGEEVFPEASHGWLSESSRFSGFALIPEPSPDNLDYVAHVVSAIFALQKGWSIENVSG